MVELSSTNFNRELFLTEIEGRRYFTRYDEGTLMKKVLSLQIIILLCYFLLVSLLVQTSAIDAGQTTGNGQLAQNVPRLYQDESSFLPIVVNVRVLFPDDQPMTDVTVVTINHEYYFRHSERTNSTGWVTFRAIPGNWSFFAFPGRSIQKGVAYFPFTLNRNLGYSDDIILKPDTEVKVELTSSVEGLIDFDSTEIWVTEASVGFFAEVGMAGVTSQNKLTLFTNGNLTARLSLNKMALPTSLGITFVSDPTFLEGLIEISLASSNTAKLTMEFRDTYNNLASGAHVQFHVMERSWQWSPFIRDYSFGKLTFVTSLSNLTIIAGTDIIRDSTRYRMLFNNKHLKPNAREEILLRFGGPLISRVLTTPKAAEGFKPATQVMLYTTDASGNAVTEVWKIPGDRLKPHLVINTTSGKRKETDMELAFASKILEEFDPSENPQYGITYDFGPYGTRTFEGGLYDSESLKMIIEETDRLIAQSPAIDYGSRFNQVEYYEKLFQSMEELMGVPTDYKIGVISNIMHAGFEDEILHGFKLELPLEIHYPPTWPLGDDFIAHEMGHGRTLKPPANYGLWGESYATLLGYKARARLFEDERLFDFLMGSHDLFLRYQHGDPVLTWYDQIETMQFITYYIDKNYGWDPHRSMILEWENAFVPIRNLLSLNGFSEIEQMATIYSYLVQKNLGWLFNLAGFDVEQDKVDAGLNLIQQSQHQSGKVELKVGETNAVTYTTSVPIMIKRAPQGVSRINLTLTFDNRSARVLNVLKRDLTSSQEWTLTSTSGSSGRLTIVLTGTTNITRPGSIAQLNFELIPSNRSELLISPLNVSINSGQNALAENGRIIMRQLSVVRPKELPFEVIYNDKPYFVTMSSNSTIRNFSFQKTNRILSFNATAPIGTIGFCNITIPKLLLSAVPQEAWIVWVDGVAISRTLTQNTTHASIYFMYTHSVRRIEIVGTYIDDTAPATTNDYDGLWHTSDFTINLTATDSGGISETYYKVNGGPTRTVSVNGQPRINIESGSNTLEYWSVDVVGNEELPHKTLTEIKLDKTVPVANAGQSQTVNTGTSVTFNAGGSTDNLGIASYDWDFGDGATGSGAIVTHTYARSGVYTANLTVRDQAGNAAANTIMITVQDNVIPEFSSLSILILFLMVSLLIVITKRKINSH